MAARKAPRTAQQTYYALLAALDGISRLFGGSTVSGDENSITVSVPHRGQRTYTVDRGDGTVLVTEDVGTPKRPRVETRRTFIEEPIALLIDYTAPHDAFSDVYSDVADYAERSLR